MATKRRVTVSATINGVDDDTFGSNEFGYSEFTRETILSNAQPQKGGSMRWFIKAITVVFLAGCATPGDKTGNDVNTFGAFLGGVLPGAAAAPGRNVEGGNLAPPLRRRGPPPNAEGREQLIDKIKNDCVAKGWVYSDLGGGGSTCGPPQVSSQPPMSADAAAATVTGTFPPPGPGVRPAFIYVVNLDGRLVWLRHDGAERGDGLSTPGAWVGSRPVGRGWEGITTVFGGGGNSIYGIDGEGLLKWYQHNGFNTGAGLEDPSAWVGPKDVGRGWGGLQHVFPGGNGIIYTIAEDGILRWLKHNGFRTGAGLETPGAWEGPKDVGRGWGGLKHVFSGGDGIIYTIAEDGILRWLKHNGFRTGAGLETPGAWTGPKDVGRGWGEATHVFALMPSDPPPVR